MARHCVAFVLAFVFYFVLHGMVFYVSALYIVFLPCAIIAIGISIGVCVGVWFGIGVGVGVCVGVGVIKVINVGVPENEDEKLFV